MAASSHHSSYHYVVDEPLLRKIAAEIKAAIPGAEVRLFGSRARGTARPDSDLDLLVTVPDGWLACHSRFEETGDLSWKLARHRIPIDLLLIRIRRYRIASSTGSMPWQRPITTGESCMPAEGQADAALMLRIAQRDLKGARSMLDGDAFEQATWRYQIQQTTEKALEAWIPCLGQPLSTHP